jgi:hypothetical protein
MSDVTGVRVNALDELGATGLVYSNAGTIEEEFLPNLMGRNAQRVYKEMRDNDAIIGALLFCIDMVLRSVQWRVEENKNATDPAGDATFLWENMQDMAHTWSGFVSEIMSMLPFGWSWFEQVYKKRSGPQDDDNPNAPASSKYSDGKIGWRKFGIRAQESLERWAFDPQGAVLAMVQRPAPTYEERIIPIQKSLLFRTTEHKNNPEGRSIFRNAYRSWFFKQKIENIEGMGIERDLVGLPVACVDPEILKPNASTDDKALLAAIRMIVQNIKRDKNEGVIWPQVFDDQGHPLYELKLLSSGGARQFDLNATITRYNQHIAMTVLADFILLGHEVVGSFALSSDKTDLFAVALGTYLDHIADVINRFAVPRLWILNGDDPSNCPKVVHGDISTPDLAVLGAYILALVQAGMPMFPDEQLENHLRQVAHLPELVGNDGMIPEMIPGINEVIINPLDTSTPKAQAQQGPGGPGQGTAGQQSAAKGLAAAATRNNSQSSNYPSPNGSGISGNGS